MRKNEFKSNGRINKIEVTEDTLTGRGGIALFVRYLEMIGIYSLLLSFFSNLRKSNKGLAVWNIFKQVFCFFYDGTCRHISYFDQLMADNGYAAVIENSPNEMASSHQIKRFFKSFGWFCGGAFRKVLQWLFIWRLRIEGPDVIELAMDTMPMDNDDAEKREGVSPTYKRYKGFQPLQISWKGKVVDAIFRGGSKHGNHGDVAVNMVTRIVRLIRKHYSDTVPIILRMDSGFFDEENFKAFDRLGIGFMATGKIYNWTKEYVGGVPEVQWGRYDNGHQEWDYIEFGYRCETWKRFYRGIYTRPRYEDQQIVMEFARPENAIITNIGVNPEVLANLTSKKREELEKVEAIIEGHHQRGADELVHRGLKDFGFEELPFKRFSANTAFYYCMLIAYFLFETFKEDVLNDIVPMGSYATTVRRKVVDFAAKIIKTGGEIILKVTKAVMENLRFEILWQRCQNPIPI